MEKHKIFEEAVINDYFTANVKAEVILDTILTPIIGEVLTVACKGKDGVNGRMRLLAKEFPILKEKGKSYRSCNADYMMCDDESVYFVELKTTMDSIDDGQLKNYITKLNENARSFADYGYDFIRLLNHVSKNGQPELPLKPQPDQDFGKNYLKLLFENIIAYSTKSSEIAVESGWEKHKNHAARAMCYLQSEKAVSSKKYLFTAGQMLDRMEGQDWWEYAKIRLLYLIPTREKQQDSDDVKYVTFEEIIKNKDDIGKNIEKRDSDLKEYWEWVVEVLERCMACNARLKSKCTGCGRQN